jgi:hypothetical protein
VRWRGAVSGETISDLAVLREQPDLFGEARAAVWAAGVNPGSMCAISMAP